MTGILTQKLSVAIFKLHNSENKELSSEAKDSVRCSGSTNPGVWLRDMGVEGQG